MRSRLRAVAVATTATVVLAFLVPLALLVRSVARDRALSAAEREAEALAPVLAVTSDPPSCPRPWAPPKPAGIDG